MDQEQQKRFREAVDRKSAAAEEASRHPEQNPRTGPPVTLDPSGEMQPGIQTDASAPQDTFSTRAKNEGKGKKTADKWNQ
jgi:hypothetical protein